MYTHAHTYTYIHTHTHTHTHTFCNQSYSTFIHFTARVVPKDLDITPGPSISTANIHFAFDDNVKDRISEFEIIATATSDSSSPIVQGVSRSDRKAELAGLTPGTTYSAKVIAKYDDGESFDSEFKEFTVPGNLISVYRYTVKYIIIICLNNKSYLQLQLILYH